MVAKKKTEKPGATGSSKKKAKPAKGAAFLAGATVKGPKNPSGVSRSEKVTRTKKAKPKAVEGHSTAHEPTGLRKKPAPKKKAKATKKLTALQKAQADEVQLLKAVERYVEARERSRKVEALFQTLHQDTLDLYESLKELTEKMDLGFRDPRQVGDHILFKRGHGNLNNFDVFPIRTMAQAAAEAYSEAKKMGD